MLYYLAEAVITDSKWLEDFDQDNLERFLKSHRRREVYRKIKESAGRFNEKLEGVGFAFVETLKDEEIRIGILAEDRKTANEYLTGFLSLLDFKVDNLRSTELTFHKMKRCLNTAAQNDFIEDADDVLLDLDLDSLDRIYYMGNLSEMVLSDDPSREKLIHLATDYLAEGSLVPELDRIYAGRQASSGFGHPVHYMILTDQKSTQKELSKILIRALYANGRLDSRRCCVMDLTLGSRVSKHQYETIYRSMGGGCAMVRINPKEDDGESDIATGEWEIIRWACEIAKKYRNQVLTFFLLPRNAEKTRVLLYDALETVRIVEIREELAGLERAKQFLEKRAEQNDLEIDDDLLTSLEEGEEYLPADLDRIYEEWSYNRLIIKAFPQYLDLVDEHSKEQRKTVRGSAFEELQEMIGLEEAKSVIQKAVKYYKVQRLYQDRGISQDRLAMHMVFTGNPGTAKSTVARLFARIMKENGLLSRGHLVEVGRSELVDRYVGWTAKTVKDKFDKAKGGVLFIDEAYSLMDDRSGSFGDEAINTIVQEMENRRDDMVVILAGYPEKMEWLLSRNPGMRSRVAFHVPFSDYDAEGLCEIARLIGKSKSVDLSQEAVDKLRTGFEAACCIPDFGNGRYVRNVIELAKMNQAERILEMDPVQITERELRTIEAIDIEFPKLNDMPVRSVIGFAG